MTYYEYKTVMFQLFFVYAQVHLCEMKMPPDEMPQPATSSVNKTCKLVTVKSLRKGVSESTK